MPDEKSPAYQWYVRDYNTDEVVVLMNLEQEGAYRRLLDHEWLNGSVPDDVRELARILRVPHQRMSRIWPIVSRKFTDRGDGRLINLRLEREREKQAEWREKQVENGRRGAQKRWSGNDSGPNRLANGEPIVSPMARNSSASASASATTETTKDKKKASLSKKISEGWSPNEKHRALGASLRVDVDLEAEKMRDWATAKGATKADWDATFRNWLRNAKPAPTTNGAKHNGGESIFRGEAKTPLTDEQRVSEWSLNNRAKAAELRSQAAKEIERELRYSRSRAAVCEETRQRFQAKALAVLNGT